MSPLPLLAAWLISSAQAQDALTARIVPLHPRPGEPVYVELEYRHGASDTRQVPTSALAAVQLTGVVDLTGARAEVIVSATAPPSAAVPAASVPWTALKPGEPLRRVLPLGDVLGACAPGCPAGAYELTLSLTPLRIEGAAADQHVPTPPPATLGFEVVAETLGVEAPGALRAELRRVRVRAERTHAKVRVTNVSTHPLRVPSDGDAVLPSCSLWWRDDQGAELGSMSTTGVGGQGALDEARTRRLAPGEAITYAVDCTAGAPRGVRLEELTVTLRPIAPFVPTAPSAEGVVPSWQGPVSASAAD
ncbi:hypothetical protein L6R49_25400 [Myxococcota bacterium]|nr:hypothetical protein [Myxococcota bacterium]